MIAPLVPTTVTSTSQQVVPSPVAQEEEYVASISNVSVAESSNAPARCRQFRQLYQLYP